MQSLSKTFLYNAATQSVAHRPTALASSGSLLEIQTYCISKCILTRPKWLCAQQSLRCIALEQAL